MGDGTGIGIIPPSPPGRTDTSTFTPGELPGRKIGPPLGLPGIASGGKMSAQEAPKHPEDRGT
jgi:hypothetical protein